ncbi:unnamed protein product [Closterium sp. Naga37s-1]|nr:unnamed protein product [Closterium sp. Naga37s-1]
MRLLWRRLALVAWCLAWLTIAVWTAWFTWQAADNPRKEDLRTWCAARTRYVHQEFVSSSNQVEILAGLVKVFNGISTTRNTPSYWGLEGGITNATWSAFSEQWIQRIQPWSLTSWGVFISHDQRPVLERILNCTVRTMLGNVAPASPRYVVSVFRFPAPYDLPPCTDLYSVLIAITNRFLLSGENVAFPPLLLPNNHIGFFYGIPVIRTPLPPHPSLEQGLESISGAIAGAIDTETLISHALMDVLNYATNKYSFDLYDATDEEAPVLMFGANVSKNFTDLPMKWITPTQVQPGYKVVQPFPETFRLRNLQAHCRFLDSGSAWRLVWAPVLVAVLVAVVAVLLTLIVVFLARKQAAISRAVREVELCTAVLERAQRSKSETVANLSHELRTPIVGMLGMMEALLESELEGGQHRDLTTAKECAAAIVGQLNSVLDLAKLHAGRLSLETLPLSLRHCVDMVARDLLPDACKRGLHCELTVEGSQKRLARGACTWCVRWTAMCPRCCWGIHSASLKSSGSSSVSAASQHIAAAAAFLRTA